MKHIILVVCLALMASTTKAIHVPDLVSKAFQQKFPTVKKVKWEKENDADFEAEFTLNGKQVSAVFAADGAWRETETELKASELPAHIVSAFNKLYPGNKIREAAVIQRLNSGTLYEIETKVNGEETDILFDASGNLIK